MHIFHPCCKSPVKALGISSRMMIEPNCFCRLKFQTSKNYIIIKKKPYHHRSSPVSHGLAWQDPPVELVPVGRYSLVISLPSSVAGSLNTPFAMLYMSSSPRLWWLPACPSWTCPSLWARISNRVKMNNSVNYVFKKTRKNFIVIGFVVCIVLWLIFQNK